MPNSSSSSSHCSSSSHGSSHQSRAAAGGSGGAPGVATALWSLTTSTFARPKPVQLQSISTHVPLQSIALAPPVDAPPAAAGADPRTQQQRQRARVQFQQPGTRPRHQHKQVEGLALLQQQQQQQQPQALVCLIAAAREQQRLPDADKELLLRQLQPLLAVLPAQQLAQAAWAASTLPGGPSIAGSPAWQQCLLEAAARHFDGGPLAPVAADRLLQGLVNLRVRPPAAWLAAACDSMDVAAWTTPRPLSSVAACLPQLGHMPSARWAQGFYTAAAANLPAFPATSLARMLHGVAAWQHMLQQRLQLNAAGDARTPQQLAPPPQPEWLLSVLQHLLARSQDLKPCEVAMVLQALQQLQHQALSTTAKSSSSSSSSAHAVLPLPGSQPAMPLQRCGEQLMCTLLDAVQQQLAAFGSLDLAVVLYSVAQLQQQHQQHQQQQRPDGDGAAAVHVASRPRCSWPWLRDVLAASQQCLWTADARTQVTMLFAGTVLIKPHMLEQHHVQEAAQQQPRGVAAADAAQPTPALQQAAQDRVAGRLVARPPRATLPRQQQEQQPLHMLLPPMSHIARRAALSGQTEAASVWLAWLHAFERASAPQLPAFSAQDVVQAACSLAAALHVPDATWYEQLLAAVTAQLPDMTPGQVSGVAWALAQMALLPCQHNSVVSLVPLQPWLAHLYRHVGLPMGADSSAAGWQEGAATSRRSCSSAELVRLMWAAGVCDFDPGDAWWAAAEQQLLLQHATLAAEAAAGRLPPVPLRLLSAMAQAYATARRRLPNALVQQQLLNEAVLQQLPHEPVDNTLRLLRGLTKAAGSSRPLLPSWVRQLATGFQGRLAQLHPAELPQLLLCLADAGLHVQDMRPQQQPWPASSWQQACVAALQQARPHMCTRDASRALWAAAKLQLPLPPALIEQLLQVLQAGFLTARPAVLAQGIDGVARLGYRPSADWLGAFLMATHRVNTAAAAAASAAMQEPHTSSTSSGSSIGASIRGRVALVTAVLQTLHGLARLEAAVQPKWLKHHLLLLHAQLPLLRPRHIASLMLALAKLRCRPSAAYLQAVLQQLGDCGSCSALDVVHIAYACARLQWRPDRAWLQRFLTAAVARLPQMTPQGNALLLWSLAVMRVRPPARWQRAAVAAVGAQVEQLDMLQLSMVVWALGRMQAHLALALPLRQQQQQPQDGAPDPGALAARQSLLPAAQLLSRAWLLRGQMSAPALVHCLVGVARLRLSPGQAWLRGMVVAPGSCNTLTSLDGYQMQQLLWALARLQFCAPLSWLQHMEELLETKFQHHNDTRQRAAWALEQLKQLVVHEEVAGRA